MTKVADLFSRRVFVRNAALSATSSLAGSPRIYAAAPKGTNPLPRWRGFNLMDFFQAPSNDEQGGGNVREEDLKWIRDRGFDFVRLPMDYWMWIDAPWRKTHRLRPDDVLEFDQRALEKVGRTERLCEQYGLHLSQQSSAEPAILSRWFI